MKFGISWVVFVSIYLIDGVRVRSIFLCIKLTHSMDIKILAFEMVLQTPHIHYKLITYYGKFMNEVYFFKIKIHSMQD